MKNRDIVILVVLGVIAAVAMILLEFVKIPVFSDERTNFLFCGMLTRGLIGVFGLWLVILIGNKKMLYLKGIPKASLLWCAPCLMVAFANFPLYALLNGTATVDRPDLIFLFILYCLSVSFMEEMMFRGVFQTLIGDRLSGVKHKNLLTIILSAALFGLIHLTNLFAGGGFFSTGLQVGYSFLIGCMMSVIVLKTNNLWVPVIIHAIFDIGGLLISRIGDGQPWNNFFWIVTITVGALCTAHILFTLVEDFKKEEL